MREAVRCFTKFDRCLLPPSAGKKKAFLRVLVIALRTHPKKVKSLQKCFLFSRRGRGLEYAASVARFFVLLAGVFSSLMDDCLETLRTRNQALLLQLHHGRQICRDVIKPFLQEEQNYPSLDKATTMLSSSVDISSQIPERFKKFSEVSFLSDEVGKARDLLRSKSRKMRQDMNSNPNPQFNNDDSDVESVKELQALSSVMDPGTANTRTPPKSILKRRKIVDDNVKVDSKFQHTPTYKSFPGHSGLNFSYSDVNDLELGRTRNEKKKDDQKKSETVSLDESCVETTKQINGQLDKETSVEKAQNRNDIERLLRNRLLRDAGNDRENAAIVETLQQRPKSVLFDTAAKEPFRNASGVRVCVFSLENSSSQTKEVRLKCCKYSSKRVQM